MLTVGVGQGDSSALTDSDSGREGAPLLTPLRNQISYQAFAESSVEVELDRSCSQDRPEGHRAHPVMYV